MASKYIALIPAYEPDRKMLGVIADLGKAGFDIVLVDDGSGVEYSELFEQAAERLPGRSGRGVTLLIHSENRGKGAALKTGLDFINNFMIIREEAQQNMIVTVDADGQHLVKDVCRAAEAASRRPGTLVLGSRGFEENVPLRSRFGNTVTREVFRLATGEKIYDTQTGLRAFTADLIPELLKVKGDRYEYEINMLMDFASGGIPVEEVRISTVYHDGNESSHFNTIKDSYRIYREIAGFMLNGRLKETAKQALKFSASSFASFLVDYAVYALLILAGPGLVFANIGARLISSAFNYTVNRRLVFRSNAGAVRSAVQYFALAALILAGNTFVLNTLVASVGIGAMAAKVMTEVLFFLISWTVQKYVIFYSGAGSGQYEQDTKADRFTVGYTAIRPKKLRNVSRRKHNEETA